MGFGNAPVFWGFFMDVYQAQRYRDLKEARGIQKLGRRPSKEPSALLGSTLQGPERGTWDTEVR